MNWTKLRILTLCLLSLIPTGAFAQLHEFSEKKQTLRVEFPYGHVHQYGFQWVRLTATNLDRKPAVWRINLWEEEFRYGERMINGGKRATVMEVAPGGTAQRDILMALGSLNAEMSGGTWNDFEVKVVMPSGIEDSWSTRTEINHYYSHDSSTLPTLLSADARKQYARANMTDGIYGVMAGPTSTDWRAYTAYNLVIISQDEWNSMAPDAQMALIDWVYLGGHLQFIDSIPAILSENTAKLAGLGAIHDAPQNTGNDQEGFDQLPSVQELSSAKTMTDRRVQANGEQVLLRDWLSVHAPSLLRETFAIWPVILVLVSFFVMITPVNLFLLAPSRRRHRLFKTIPIISLAACLALAVAVLVGDGMGGKGQRLVHIESRPGNDNVHYISQWQASHAGALFGTSFTVSDSAYMCPLGELGSDMTLRIESDQLEGGGGWFSSRSNQSQSLKAVRSSRGRIEWTQEADGPISVVSTFGFPIRDFYTRDEDGNWWHAASLSQGQRVQLKAVAEDHAVEQLKSLTHKAPYHTRLRKLARDQGHFIAFTDTPPAIETLGSIRWNDTGIITGQLAQP